MWNHVRLNFTVSEAAALFQLGAAQPDPGGLVQEDLLAARGPGGTLLVFSVLVPVLVWSRSKDASEDFLTQPRLAALCDVTEEAGQRAARPPSTAENPEKKKFKS